MSTPRCQICGKEPLSSEGEITLCSTHDTEEGREFAQNSRRMRTLSLEIRERLQERERLEARQREISPCRSK